ncbi:MAG: metallophosphoesterase family protein [Opitutaceae bacterium]
MQIGATLRESMGLRIAIISDSHDRLPALLPERLRGATEIWHLGDVCLPGTLAPLEALGVPLHVVRGNCDWVEDWPESLLLERGGARFRLVHVPPARVGPGIAALLHGHTHVPRDETDPLGVRWLNPGCLAHANRGAPPSFAWIEFGDNGWRWRLERL